MWKTFLSEKTTPKRFDKQGFLWYNEEYYMEERERLPQKTNAYRA